jgi:GT2 family glycosyltransferase
VIPVLGFCTLKRFDLAERLMLSIDHPVEHLVVIDNSGTQNWMPPRVAMAKNQWNIQVPHGLGLVGAWNLIVKTTPFAPYWLLVNDDAWFEAGALSTIAEDANRNSLNFLDITPTWSAIVLGEKVVAEVGLYDERLYPLYFDDNDYQRRIEKAGFVINHIEAKVHHENSSTLKSGYQDKNNKTFAALSCHR